MAEINATDLGVDMDDFEDTTNTHGFILLEGCESWSMAGHALARANLGPCPICGGVHLRRTRYCLGCDRTGLDGRVSFPGLDVDERPDPDWHQDDEVRVYDGLGRRLAS